MIPIRGKTYKIKYYPGDPNPTMKDFSFEGVARCNGLGDDLWDDDYNPLYSFEELDGEPLGFFAEADVVEEVL